MGQCTDCPHLLGATATMARSACCMDDRDAYQTITVAKERDNFLRLADDVPFKPTNRHERRRMAKLGR